MLGDPAAAAAGQLTEATGLAGSAQAELVTSVALSPMAVLTLVAGAMLVLLGVLVLLLGGRWKAAGRKYEADSGSARPATDEPDRISDSVSYTHLDVYKRQSRGSARGLRALAAGASGGPTAAVERLRGLSRLGVGASVRAPDEWPLSLIHI